MTVLLALIGCPWVSPEDYDVQVQDVDGDGERAIRFGGRDCLDDNPLVVDCDADDDGFRSLAAGGPDCDDTNRAVHPEAIERCNVLDDDCNGLVDDDDDGLDLSLATVWYADSDDDGFGSEATRRQCIQPSGFVRDPGDCNDGTAAIGPNAPEQCDPIDHNCDGDLYANAENAVPIWPDTDGDGFGDADTVPVLGCLVGAVADQGDDCNDADPTVFGGEICDGIDNDCDGLVDDADPSTDPATRAIYYQDLDGDGFGADAVNEERCDPAGWVAIAGDCDDSLAAVAPDQDEVCDNRDNDCDGTVDQGAIDANTFFLDADGDGHGRLPLLACFAGAGISPLDDDCNDAQPTVYPGAPEICGDALRQDCLPFAVDDCDADGESLGVDCNDEDPTINTSAAELCDGLDNNCNGLLDSLDPAVTGPNAVYFVDADGDGFGSSAIAGSGTPTCDAPAGSVSNSTDCDDTNPLTRPGANERCDGEDNDCDGSFDELPVVDAPTYYRDADLDGAGNLFAPSTSACDAPDPTGWVLTPTDDCDDTEAARFPGNEEICDGLDNDCDGLGDLDDPDLDLPDWFLDNDGDGFGQSGVVEFSCAQPTGYAPIGEDCNDNDASSQAQQQWFRDADGDGYGDQSDTLLTCSTPVGYVALGTDCDDARPDISPAAIEICNALDDDCDGDIDNDDTDTVASLVYRDEDGDTFGTPPAEARCVDAGWVVRSGDCDDSNPAQHPDATEACDTVDTDCNGVVDDIPPFGTPVAVGASLVWLDNDGDGVGAGAQFQVCTPTFEALVDGDCNDTASDVYPGAPEVCDGRDNDCDTLVDLDDTGLIDGQSGFRDLDGDGFGSTPDGPFCTLPLDLVSIDGDCNDTSPSVHPGAIEVCDALNVDEDCDGLADDADAGPWIGRSTYMYDEDGDDYHLAASDVLTCDAPGLDWIAILDSLGEDCDDTTPGPDCPYYLDADGDGYGDALSPWSFAGSPPPSYVQDDTDCNDANDWIGPVTSVVVYPGAASSVDETLSQMCDGMTLQLLADIEEGFVISADRTVTGQNGGGRFQVIPPVGQAVVVAHPNARLESVVLDGGSGANSVVASVGTINRSLLSNFTSFALEVDGTISLSQTDFLLNGAALRLNDGAVVTGSFVEIREHELTAFPVVQLASSATLSLNFVQVEDVRHMAPGAFTLMDVHGMATLQHATFENNQGTIVVDGALTLDRNSQVVRHTLQDPLFDVTGTLTLSATQLHNVEGAFPLLEGSGQLTADHLTIAAPLAGPWIDWSGSGAISDSVVGPTLGSPNAGSVTVAGSVLDDSADPGFTGLNLTLPSGQRMAFIRAGSGVPADRWDLHLYSGSYPGFDQVGFAWGVGGGGGDYFQDANADGVPDGWVLKWGPDNDLELAALDEFTSGGHPDEPDTDGDGATDFDEWSAGTRADDDQDVP